MLCIENMINVFICLTQTSVDLYFVLICNHNQLASLDCSNSWVRFQIWPNPKQWNGICWSSAKHALLRIKSKGWAWSHNKVSKWCFLCTRGQLHLWDSTPYPPKHPPLNSVHTLAHSMSIFVTVHSVIQCWIQIFLCDINIIDSSYLRKW